MVIFIVWITFVLLQWEKLESNKKVFEGFYNIIMLCEDSKILEFNQYQKSNKTPFLIYANLECLIAKIDGCKNNPLNSYITKVSGHIHQVFQCL